MPSCAVPGCQNGTAARKSYPEGIKFFSFPKEKELALKWWHAVKRADSNDTKCPGCVQLQEEKLALEHDVEVLENEKKLIQEEKKQLEQQLLELRAQLQCSTSSEKTAHAAMKAGLFTEQQAEYLVTGIRPCPWDDDCLHEALRHRVNRSRRQYEWLRGNGYPLPALPTLQRYLATFVLRPNDPTIQLELLAKMTAGMTDQERQCVVMYDEMSIQCVATYDQQLDQVLGPHKQLQQFLVGGLFTHWAVPVLFQFDTAVTTTTLCNLIQGIEAAGARVVATVSDMGGSNQGVWTALGVSHEHRTWFQNPADPERRVWVLADPPHVLKCLRNNLLDSGIRTSGGGTLNKALMEDMIAINGAAAEYRVAHRVQLETHVKVWGMARQKVRPAMELVSASVALAIERHLGREEEVRALRIFDAGMDVLNAIHPRDVKPLRRGYCGTPEQETALTALEAEAKAMRVGSRKDSLIAFQKGIVMCVASVRGLLHDLRVKFGDDTFILTRRLSQDRLEGFFGMVRGKGGANANPSPTEVRARLRLLTLLFAIQRGVRPLSVDGPTATAPEAADPDWQAQLENMEEDRESALDGEVAADLQETAAYQSQPAAEESELADLEELLELANNPAAAEVENAAGPSDGARDRLTGVRASDSAMAYVAGYVARKRPIDCASGAPTAEASVDEPLEALWTRLRSHGGLTVPNAAFMTTFRHMEAAFCAHHSLEPDGLSRKPGVIRSFSAVLDSKFSGEVPPTVRRTFARVRTFIRMHYVNAQRRTNALANLRRERRKRRAYVSK